MTTARSQSQAMPSPQAAVAPQQPVNPETNPSQGSPLHPGWIHAITNLMSHPLTSDTGEKLQKWVLNQVSMTTLILWSHGTPLSLTRIEIFKRHPEPDGTFNYLQPNTVKQLVGFKSYMLMIMRQSRPADQKYNTFYYLLDEQWTSLIAHDMSSVLVNSVLENHGSQATPGTPMSHITSPSSPASMRSPIHTELISFKKSIKREAFLYAVLKDVCYFDNFQRDLFITAKSDHVSEIPDPNFTPGHSPEEKELFEAKQVYMYKVFNEALMTDIGKTKVRKYLKTSDAQAVWKEYSEYMTTASKGASEKRKFTQYVTNMCLIANSGEPPSNLFYTSLNNSGNWKNSPTHLKEFHNPS